LIYLSTSPSLKAGEKQFLKVSTIVQMLKESRLKDQVLLFRHIRLRCLQDHQTPSEKVRACESVTPNSSQSYTSRFEKKSILWKSMWFQRLHPNGLAVVFGQAVVISWHIIICFLLDSLVTKKFTFKMNK
jgi:hypothetical protein